jgi:glycerophosphoryl diester phosphodiesterase
MPNRLAGTAALLVMTAFAGSASAQSITNRPGAGAVTTPAPGIARMREKFLKQRGVMVFAHRACWHYAPENSLSAMRVCEELGVDGIETDIRRTADGQFVIMHDATVDRTTNGHGRVSEIPLAQFKALRLRMGMGGPSAFITDEAPPTFAELLEEARDRLLIDLDIKDGDYLAAVMEAKRLGRMDLVILQTRHDPDDARLKAILEAAGTDLIYGPAMREVDGIDIERTAARYHPVPPSFQSTSPTKTISRAVSDSSKRFTA